VESLKTVSVGEETTPSIANVFLAVTATVKEFAVDNDGDYAQFVQLFNTDF
jgi:hypothetical protein